jgi:hypothetical protein
MPKYLPNSPFQRCEAGVALSRNEGHLQIKKYFFFSFVRFNDTSYSLFGDISGFVYSCTYKGRDCSNSRFVIFKNQHNNL